MCHRVYSPFLICRHMEIVYLASTYPSAILLHLHCEMHLWALGGCLLAQLLPHEERCRRSRRRKGAKLLDVMVIRAKAGAGGTNQVGWGTVGQKLDRIGGLGNPSANRNIRETFRFGYAPSSSSTLFHSGGVVRVRCDGKKIPARNISIEDSPYVHLFCLSSLSFLTMDPCVGYDRQCESIARGQSKPQSQLPGRDTLAAPLSACLC
jgi:hypothetical protein